MMRRASQHGASSSARRSDRRRPSHITPGHVRAFQMVTSGLYPNVTLWSCRIDGHPGVAIVLVDDAGEGHVAVMPLFVAITEHMHIDFESDEVGGRSSGGGPKRSTVLREFAANTAACTPGGDA